MDYLEEAKSYMGFEGKDKDTWSEQVNAIRPIALALVAIAERLDKIDRVDILSAVDARMTRGESRIEHIDKRSIESEEAIDALWKRFELVEHSHIMNRDRIDKLEEHLSDSDQSSRITAIEKTLSGVATWCGAIEKRIEIIDGVLVNDAPRAGKEIQPALREKLAELMRESKDAPDDFYCSITVGERGDEMAQMEVTLGDLRRIVLAMNIRPDVEAQPALWEKLENANADVERLKRQAIRDDEQHLESSRYAKTLEDKLGNILDLLKRNLPLDELEKAILEATR